MSLVEQAEKQLVKDAKHYEDLLRVIEAIGSFGSRACHEYVGREDFMDGIRLLRIAIMKEQHRALSHCFIFAGVGGGEAEKYSREKFKGYFIDDEDRYAVIHFLEEFSHMPTGWLVEDEEKFREEAKEKFKTNE